MLLTDVAGAASVFAAAPSKVPFYVLGSLLAAWAVALFAYGSTHPGFPGSLSQQRLVMATSLVLVAATLSAAVVTGGEEEGQGAPAAAAPPARALELTADPSGAPAYDEDSVAVRAGEVPIRFTNRSPAPHDVTIARGEEVLAGTKTIQDSTATRTVRLEPGEYVFFCSVDAHRQAGMEGTLTVL